MALRTLLELSPRERNAVVASFLGWALDAFDFFLLVFVIPEVGHDFHASVEAVSAALLVTLAARPVGALLFGVLADRYGRRPTMMANVLLFSLIELLSAFAPSLAVFLVLRAVYGVAMGGEWGVGASLVMETVRPEARGVVSGLLQEGYAIGYLLAALAYAALFPLVGWRGLFVVGVAPALLALFVRTHVEESPVFAAGQAKRAERPLAEMWEAVRGHGRRFAYLVVLMALFNLLSHGTQDLYPTFLKAQRHLGPREVGAIAVIYNVGALLGGVVFGTLSERLGRRRAIALATLLALPFIPLWAFGHTAVVLGAGAFLLQFAVQGAWGVVPAHLNELSPEGVRGTFPGFAYQLGNLLASANAPVQAAIAAHLGGSYSVVLAGTAALAGLALTGWTLAGREARGAAFGGGFASGSTGSAGSTAA
ncbi:MAG TPA: MFS transporter [Myxococcales bacterium]|nr:MFS transporter [Myxococcales bacterium]